MKLDKQISNEKMAENRDDDDESGTTTTPAPRAADKETKEQMNERLAGTSKGGAAPNDLPDAPDNKNPPITDEGGKDGAAPDSAGDGGDLEGVPEQPQEDENTTNTGDEDNNKLSEELSEKEEEEKGLEDVDEPEKVEQELDENAQKESSESIHDPESKVQIVNLETIREGEVLEIPPDSVSPSALKINASKPRFYFDDNTKQHIPIKREGSVKTTEDEQRQHWMEHLSEVMNRRYEGNNLIAIPEAEEDLEVPMNEFSVFEVEAMIRKLK
ncbi:neuromodulin-like [Palaemon carinicauda]|uniref:neuromodulin-like n=1 Tax=Palaemon carinicauda TaxID=392227 RepID=UPI0035B62612